MLTVVSEVAQLVGGAKGSSGLSFRDLAVDADVAVSTLTRVNRSAMDPTYDTLSRVLGAAGYELRAVLRVDPAPPTVAGLAFAWTERNGRVRPDWARWRAMLDQLVLEPDRVAEAIYLSPPPSGSPVIDALLAAVAEKLADDAGLRRPAWTDVVAGLSAPWKPPARSERHDIPYQFASRGLMVDAASLWRDPATVGA